MPLYRRALVPIWQDFEGATATQLLVMQDQTEVALTTEAPLLSAMAELSEAALQVAFLQELKSYGGSGGEGPYATMLDVALFTFLAADESAVYVNLFAPKETIFSDAVQVDLANADVVEFVAQMIALVQTPGGSPLVSLQSAVRSIVKRQ